jgi:hypothetical protein
MFIVFGISPATQNIESSFSKVLTTEKNIRTIKNMKKSYKIKVLAVIVATVLTSALLSQAVPLGVGQTILTPGPVTVGGSLVAGSMTVRTFLTGGGESGTLTSYALSGDPGNTLGGLTFVYQLSMGVGYLQGLSVNGFGGFTTGTGIATSLSLINPLSVSRSTIADFGDTIHWDFAQSLTAPSSSAYLILETDSQVWTLAIEGVIDGGVATVEGVSPRATTVPDGGMTIALMGFALMGVEALRRRLS